MTRTKNKYSITKATKGTSTWYLSARDEAQGVDIRLDMKGYKVIAL